MDSTCIHYIEFGVKNGLEHVQRFLSQYKFRIIAVRNTPVARQWLMCSHSIRFVITELSDQACDLTCQQQEDPYLLSWHLPTKHPSDIPRDSVFNVALCVKDIDSCLKRIAGQGVQILKPIRTLSDATGTLRICTVKSCVGNVVHTLIDSSKYSGAFLPGFQLLDSSGGLDNNHQDISRGDLFYVDHIAFSCHRGSSASVLEWYEKCFGMKRFFINRDEKEDEGFVISGEDVGLRLKALEYWKCAETGVLLETNSKCSVKFVFSEALPDQGPNQTDTFLSRHGGPGVQHVGLHTNDIVSAISRLQLSGVTFNEPPPTYYTEAGRLQDIAAVGLDVQQLQNCGVLIDTETVGENNPAKLKYLMQKFTTPLFDSETFFLEVIQRVGATGFGAGNITALFRSLQAYLRQKGIEKISLDQ